MKVLMTANASVDKITEKGKDGEPDKIATKEFLEGQELDVDEKTFKSIKQSCISGKAFKEYKNRMMNSKKGIKLT